MRAALARLAIVKVPIGRYNRRNPERRRPFRPLTFRWARKAAGEVRPFRTLRPHCLPPGLPDERFMSQTEAETKLSPVEGIKETSNYLRGSIAEELAQPTASFNKPTTQLIKFHGSYQQDDRENRESVEGKKSAKDYIFMVRCRMPGGRLTSKQLVSLFEIGEELANSTIRLTTRQGVQFHGVRKAGLRPTIRRINAIALSTKNACGDVCRNVMATPVPIKKPYYDEVQRLADAIADRFAAKSRGYYEIWLRDPDGAAPDQLVGGTAEDDFEPIYGKTYLPRKFKIVVGFAFDNSVDLYAHEVGLMAILRDEKIVGYNVIVGGSFGVTPANKKTFPAVGKRMCFVTPDQVLDVVEAIVKVQRDFGNREDRKLARMKYLIANWGLERFRSKVEEYYGAPLADLVPDDVHGHDDGMGWREQGDGRYFYGLNVENGRLYDDEKIQWKAAIREICGKYDCDVRVTPHQSLIFCDLPLEAREVIYEILDRHHVPRTESISTVRRWSMACVALPTCGLAITESERILPGIIDELEPKLAELDLEDEIFTVRATGCPNGCARPYNCDVGIVGKAKDRYTLFLGGRVLGDRLNFIYKDLVPRATLVDEIGYVLAYFKEAREESESFGEFCARKGKEDLLAWTAAKFPAGDGKA